MAGCSTIRQKVWVGMNTSGELYEHEDRHVVLDWVEKQDTQDSPSMPELPEFTFEIPVQKKAIQWHELPHDHLQWCW